MKYKVTQYVEELGMAISIEETSDLSIEEFRKACASSHKRYGLKRPLAKLISIEAINV